LSLSDSFYYEKPLDTRSIYYLILRFLGDMCSNILLVYDKSIESNRTSNQRTAARTASAAMKS
jgi:hypothetical protein